MRILWVADFGLHHNIGGSQRTDSFVIAEGKRRGHEIIPFNHDSQDILLTASYDMVVSNNLEALCRNPNLFNFLLNHPRHVRFEHDSNAYLAPDARQALFNSTVKNIFLSDFHHKSFVHLYGDIFPNVEICSPYIDPEVFKDRGEEREDATAYVGFFHFLKGTNSFMEKVLMNPDEKFVVAGWGDPFYERQMRSFKNVEFLGKVSHDEMPNIFNRYTKLYYHPEKFEPFCRSVGEAIMCGIKPDTSNNIGAVADYTVLGLDKMTENCSTADKRWWSLVE